MTVQTFVSLFVFFSALSGLTTEAIKRLMDDKEHVSYNLIALISAVVIGIIGTVIYYQLNGIKLTIDAATYSILLGFACGLSSMVGYDKIKQLIEQIETTK